jgi:hypothetical protein
VLPTADKGGESGSNSIDPLLPFCQQLSHIVSLLAQKHEPARWRTSHPVASIIKSSRLLNSPGD